MSDRSIVGTAVQMTIHKSVSDEKEQSRLTSDVQTCVPVSKNWLSSVPTAEHRSMSTRTARKAIEPSTYSQGGILGEQLQLVRTGKELSATVGELDFGGFIYSFVFYLQNMLLA